jgi:hypothetical protein
MEEVTEEPLYRDQVRGIDIGKARMAVTVRVPSGKDPSRRASENREFGTTKREVLALAGWLRSWQVPAVVMEQRRTTEGPVYRLEAGGPECVLADARQVKNLPGLPDLPVLRALPVVLALGLSRRLEFIVEDVEQLVCGGPLDVVGAGRPVRC